MPKDTRSTIHQALALCLGAAIFTGAFVVAGELYDHLPDTKFHAFLWYLAMYYTIQIAIWAWRRRW